MIDNDREGKFKNWLGQYGGIVGKVARAYSRTPEDFQDLMQEILLQVWKSIPSFRKQASPCTWVYRVALNTALSQRRNEKRRVSRERPFSSNEEAMSAAPFNPQQTLADSEEIERLYAGIRSLPEAEAALLLLFLEGLTYSQIAEVLGISESHVGVKLYRAKKLLAEVMKGKPHGF